MTLWNQGDSLLSLIIPSSNPGPGGRWKGVLPNLEPNDMFGWGALVSQDKPRQPLPTAQ